MALKNARALSYDKRVLEFHRANPGTAVLVFGRAHAPDGRSSYELLADAVGSARHIVEFGCGEGILLQELARRNHQRQLVGIDICLEELVCARKKLPKEIGLVCAGAEDTGLQSASFDLVISHMSWMLSCDAAAVADEAHRLLRPGGRFAAVVGRRNTTDPLRRAFFHSLRHALDAAGINFVIGDSRTSDPKLVPALFPAAGWNVPACTPFEVVADIHLDQLGPFLSIAHYAMHQLPPKARQSVERDVLGVAEELATDGIVRWRFPMLLVQVTAQ